MHIEINCKNNSAIDPIQRSSQNAYLRICVEMTTEQAIDALEGLLGSGLINNSIVKQSLKEHRPDLIESIEDDAVSNAGEAYCEQRDRMATS